VQSSSGTFLPIRFSLTWSSSARAFSLGWGALVSRLVICSWVMGHRSVIEILSAQVDTEAQSGYLAIQEESR
jgi:hypothetical protein